MNTMTVLTALFELQIGTLRNHPEARPRLDAIDVVGANSIASFVDWLFSKAPVFGGDGIP